MGNAGQPDAGGNQLRLVCSLSLGGEQALEQTQLDVTLASDLLRTLCVGQLEYR